MGLAAELLPEFDHEMANTRRVLERIPDAELDWKPHAKSTAFGGLATHLANLPTWVMLSLQQDSFDIAPDGGGPPRRDAVTSIRAALELFDKNVADARTAFAAASDDLLRSDWSLLANGKTVFTMSKAAVVRRMVLNHMIHHRGQLVVYLRLHDIPLPALYGATADEAR